MAEYFRDQEADKVLLLINNIFCLTKAGSKVSTLLDRTSFAVCYQSTLVTNVDTMQERLTTTKKGLPPLYRLTMCLLMT